MEQAIGGVILEVLLVLQNFDEEARLTQVLEGITISEVTGVGATSLPLTIVMERPDGESGWTICCRYDVGRYDHVAMERLAQHLGRLLGELVLDPRRSVGECEMLAPEERQALLASFCSTDAGSISDLSVHAQVERQVGLTPDSVAVLFQDQQQTYAELDAQADQIARQLRQHDVAPGSTVGLLIEGCLDLPAVLLGVLKANAAYLPLDSGLSAEQTRRIIDDAEIDLLVTNVHRSALQLGTSPKKLMLTECLAPAAAGPPTSFPRRGLQHPACLIYESESTRTLRAMTIHHEAVCNYLKWLQKAFPLDADDVVLQRTSISSAASIGEIFAPLLTGGRLAVMPPGEQLDPAALLRFAARHGVTSLRVDPQLLGALLDAGLDQLQTLRRVLSGDASLPGQLKARFLKQVDAQLGDLYGPAEATILSLSWLPSEGVEAARYRRYPELSAGAFVRVLPSEELSLDAIRTST